MSEIVKEIKPKTSTFLPLGNRKVKQALLHQAILWPGKIGSDANIQSRSYKGLEMWWIPNDGLILTMGKESYTVPPANIYGMVHE